MEKKITTKYLYDLISRYVTIKEDNSLLRILFDWEDKNSDVISKFSYTGTNNETVYVGQYGYSYRLERIFNVKDKEFTGELLSKWIKGISNSHKGLFQNIENVFKYVPMNEIDSVYQELKDINDSLNLPYDVLISDKRSESIEIFYRLFLYTIGDNIDIDNSEKKIETSTYIPQYITSLDKSKVVHIEAPNFSVLENNKYILVEGPGGIGKTTFINKLYEKATEEKYFKNVYKIDLSQFFEYLKEKVEIVRNSDSSYLVLYLSKIYRCMPEDINFNGKTLLLLDGLNEVYLYNDLRIRNLIFSELNNIKNHMDNISILITTRESSGEFGYKNIELVKNFNIYFLSGVRDKERNELKEKYVNLPESILELTKIPLYYNAIKKIGTDTVIKNKYDLLKEIYYQRYEQSSIYNDSFFAFYILSPKLAKYLNDNGKHSLSRNEIINVLKGLLIKKELPLLISSAKLECLDNNKSEVEIDNVLNIMTSYGPLKLISGSEFEEEKYKFFHEEIEKYLLALNSFIDITSIKMSLSNDDFSEISDIDIDLSYDDNTIELLRMRLDFGFNDYRNEEKIINFFKISDSFKNLPKELMFIHIAFLFSEFVRFGKDEISAIHYSMLPFTKKMIEVLEDGNIDTYFKNLTSSQILKCKSYFIEILSKHSEYYRKNKEYEEGLKLLDISDSIIKDESVILNQRAKLYFKIFEESINIKDAIFNPDRISLSDDLKKIYYSALSCTNLGVEKGFNLSINLLQSVLTVPNPLFFLIPHQSVDYVDAFNKEYSIIFGNNNLKGYDILYTIRQALNLLIKGYVKVRDGYTYRKDKVLKKDDIVLSNMNTFSINENTINLAKDILEKIEGYNYNSLNYYRGIVKYYEKDYESCKNLLLSEESAIQSKIILNYKFGYNYDLDKYYEGIVDRLLEGRTTYESCDPVYYGIFDAMNLELSLKPERTEYFDNLIDKLPKLYQDILNIIRKKDKVNTK